MRQTVNLTGKMWEALLKEVKEPDRFVSAAADRYIRVSLGYREDIQVFNSFQELWNFLNCFQAESEKVNQAYRIILRRRPDPPGFRSSIAMLRKSGLGRLILTLYYSDEKQVSLSPGWRGVLEKSARKYRSMISILLVRLGFSGLVRI